VSTALAIRHLGFEHLGVWHTALESRGFAIRYVAHLKQKREIQETKREAERR